MLQLKIIVVSFSRHRKHNLSVILNHAHNGEAMNSKPAKLALPPHTAEENIAYIRQMLGELRTVANNEGADMVRYLIEMAYVEAGDIQSGVRPLSAGRPGHSAAGMPLKTSGKIKF